MRGNHIHGLLLVCMHAVLAKVDALVHEEYWVDIGFIDLFATYRDLRIAIEAERSCHRVENDVRKAIAANATHLLIVTPSARVARAVQRKLRTSPITDATYTSQKTIEHWILPLARAEQALAQLLGVSNET